VDDGGETNEILDFCEEQPSFPGGQDSMKIFLKSNMSYPPVLKDTDVQGTVYVQLIVEVDGSLTNAVVVRKVSPLLDAEALRLIHIVPKWIPGMQSGKKARVRYVIPISFRIE